MMRLTSLSIAVVLTLGLVAGAAAQPFTYEGLITVNNTPLGLATDSSGGLYYVTFDAASSSAYYIADPVAAIGTTTGGALIDTIPMVGGRGLMGIQVDSGGNVYISGDNGGGANTILRKYGPAPTFTADATFNTNTDVVGPRAEACALLGDGTIAVATFSGIEYFATADGLQTGYTVSAGGTTYQREPIYNSIDNVIYGLKNGSSSAVMVSGYYGGGTVGAGGYTWNAGALISDGSLATAFGGATQHGWFDATTSPPRLYTVDTDPNGSGNREIRVWEVTASGATLTDVASIDNATPSTAPDPAWTDTADCVRIGSRLYVSSGNADAIYVYGSAIPVELSVFSTD